MTCTGVCTLCGLNRDSRLCRCLDRIRSGDGIHESLRDAETFIAETRFFGNAAKDTAFELILQGRQTIYSQVANGTIKDSTILIRIDRDVETLKTRAKGKLFATAQKMSEQPKRPSPQNDGMSNVERLTARLLSGLPHTV